MRKRSLFSARARGTTLRVRVCVRVAVRVHRPPRKTPPPATGDIIAAVTQAPPSRRSAEQHDRPPNRARIHRFARSRCQEGYNSCCPRQPPAAERRTRAISTGFHRLPRPSCPRARAAHAVQLPAAVLRRTLPRTTRPHTHTHPDTRNTYPLSALPAAGPNPASPRTDRTPHENTRAGLLSRPIHSSPAPVPFPSNPSSLSPTPPTLSAPSSNRPTLLPPRVPHPLARFQNSLHLRTSPSRDKSKGNLPECA